MPETQPSSNRDNATPTVSRLSAEAGAAQPPAVAATAAAPADTRPRNCPRDQDEDEDHAWSWSSCPAPSSFSAALIDTDNPPACIAVASPARAAVDAEVKVELLSPAKLETATPAPTHGGHKIRDHRMKHISPHRPSCQRTLHAVVNVAVSILPIRQESVYSLSLHLLTSNIVVSHIHTHTDHVGRTWLMPWIFGVL